MRLLQAQFGGVFDGQHTLAGVDHLRQRVQHGGFTRTRTTRDNDVHPACPGNFQRSTHLLAHRTKVLEHVESDGLFGKLTNRNGRALQRQRRHDYVNTAAIFQASIGQWRGLIDAAADLVYDSLRNLEQMRFVTELDRRELQLALLFNVSLLRAVDHDVGYVRIAKQLFQWTKAEQFIDKHLLQRKLLAPVQRDFEFGKHFQNDRTEFFREFVLAECGRRFGINPFQQARQYLFLDLVDAGFKAAHFGISGMAGVHPFRQAGHCVAICGQCARARGRSFTAG